MSVTKPICKVEFKDKSDVLRFGFGPGYNAYVSSLRIKPGLTSAIGSFEVNLVDTGSDANGIATGMAFKDIALYEPVYFYFGYTGAGVNYAGTGYHQFKGFIDTIKLEFDNGQYTRTYSGRDPGEALFRVLGRRAFTGSCSSSAVSIKNDIGLNSDNQFIGSSTDIYYFVLSNDNYFKGLKEVSDINNKDFYVDTGSKLHWFERQSLNGPETFSVGANILSYRLFRDITESKNQYYIFGSRDPASITGSYIPVGHDEYTESIVTGYTTGWSGSAIYSGGAVTPARTGSTTTTPFTGSASVFVTTSSMPDAGDTTLILEKTLPSRLMILDGDFLHFAVRFMDSTGTGTVDFNNFIRLKTDEDNYFECKYEQQTVPIPNPGSWTERTIELGPQFEGVSAPAGLDTTTGSHKWTRSGSPDWFNINYIEFRSDFNGVDSTPYINIDNLYFGVRFQFASGSTGSQTLYGLREEVVIDSKYNSTLYCKNIATEYLTENSGSTMQVEIIATGSPGLQVGNKYTVTIPAEGVDTYLELIDLEHFIDENGYTTKCLFTDKKQIRTPIPVLNYSVFTADYKIDIIKEAMKRMGVQLPRFLGG